MKPIKKRTAKVFIGLIVVAMVLGTLFTFVPMHGKTWNFASMMGLINTSSDLGPGVYAEYDVDGKYTDNQISNSLDTIRDVLEEEGFAGANVFAVEKKKVRIEVGYSNKEGDLKEKYSLLSAIGVGVFELRSSSSEDDTYVNGKDHIKSVDINTYNDSTYVVLNFNSAGEKAYADLLEACQANSSNTVYVCMGGEIMTSFSVSDVTSASSSMPLSFTDYEQARNFAIRVRLGSLSIKLNPDTVVIDTMSTTMGRGNLTANPAEKGFSFSVTKLVALIAIAIVIVVGLGYLAIKYGIMSLFVALSLLFSGIIITILLSAFTWVEISFSSLVGVAFGIGILMTSAVIFLSRFEEEYNQGKTILASLESGFKRSVAPIISTGLALTVIFGVVAIVAGTELKVFGLITCLSACLSLFSSLIMLPGFIKIFEAFNDGAIKPYRLKERKEGENND